MTTFCYPEAAHTRRHGPAGYSNYRRFRPWLRDEFCFRCIYCLSREQWCRAISEFDLDHFRPQSLSPAESTDYDNLLFACRPCNALKGSQELPDPCQTLTSNQIRVRADGTIEGLTAAAKKTIRTLCLDSERFNKWRRMWIRIVELAEECDPQQYKELMGFPADLPELRRLRPPRNSRPDGVNESYHAKRERGELPEVY